ncbi:UNVERIFIED_ORG: muconolactone delta-isomerase [Sphingomonas sp. R1F5B]
MALFDDLPRQDVPLTATEQAFLETLPVYAPNCTIRALYPEEEAMARHLAKRGLVHLHRWRDDPSYSDATSLFAGRTD